MASRASGVKIFSYSDEILNALQASLSRERLGTYLDAAGGDRERAIRLHVWNTAVSAAFYGPLQGLRASHYADPQGSPPPIKRSPDAAEPYRPS